MPKGVGFTEIRNRKEGLKEFMTRDDKNQSIDLERLREQYLGDKKAPLQQKKLLSEQDLDRYIDINKQKQAREPLRLRVQKWFDERFLIETGKKSVYLWRSRAFEEIAFMYVPRFLFLTGSAYFIYRITLKQHENMRVRSTVRSHRQEQIDQQLE